jgi:hypothetical protein
MARCHKCGREIPRRTGVYKVLKTGKYSGGSDYHRTVSLCDNCAQNISVEEETKKKKQTTMILIIVVALALVGVLVYVTQFR